MLDGVRDNDTSPDDISAGPAGGDRTGGGRTGGEEILRGNTPRAWSPPWWRVALYAVAGAVTLTVAAVGELAYRLGSLDAAGRLLVAVVGAGLLGLAIRDGVARPTLRVDNGGIDLVDGIRRRHLPWAAVLGVRAGTLTHNRRGVHVRVLEVTTIDGPVLLSRRQLGAGPERVADAVEEIRLRLDPG